MKKIMIMLGFLALLTACTQPMLKRKSSTNIGKTILENGVKYRNAEIGHSSEVVSELIKGNENGVSLIHPISGLKIYIPIEYTETIPSLPKKLPTVFHSIDKSDFTPDNTGILVTHSYGKTTSTLIPSKTKELVLGVGYNNILAETGSLLLSPALPIALIGVPIVLAGVVAAPFSKGIELTSIEDGKYWEFQAPAAFSKLNDKNIGVSMDVTYSPEELHISCEKKNCMIVDKNNRPINKIYIHKELKIDQNRINELLLEEKKEKERQAKEEAERKRQQRIFEAKQKKECPALHTQLLYIQRFGAYDPVGAVKTANRYQELGCGYYIQQQMSSYYY